MSSRTLFTALDAWYLRTQGPVSIALGELRGAAARFLRFTVRY